MRAVPRTLPFLILFAAACAGGGTRSESTRASLDERALEPPAGRTLVLTGDLRLAPGDYLRPAPGGEPVVLLEGLRDVELDLEGVHLRGQAEGAPLDEARGVGLLVRDCEGLVLRGGNLSGYRVGLLIESSRDVRVEGLSVTDSFATELLGAPDRPHPADRIDLTRPERWIDDFGAAIAVRSSSRVVLEGTRSRRGQNGVLFVDAQGCELRDADHSYLSGWGVALTGSVGCTVASSRFDACARGISGDAPPDGLGAAGLFVGPGCERNDIVHNVARGCGDGLRVEGDGSGAGNLWFGNDLAGPLASAGLVRGAANERFVGNRMSGGEWRGLHVELSDGVVVYGNEFRDVHGTGLSVVSSTECLLVGNEVLDCDRGLLVRGRDGSDGYDSSDHWIVDNEIEGAIQDVVLERSRGLVFEGNRFDSPAHRVHIDGLTAIGFEGEARELWSWLKSPDSGAPSGRATDVELARPDGPRPPALLELAHFAPPATDAEAVDWRRSEPPRDVVLGAFTPWDPESGAERPRATRRGGLFVELDWDATWFDWDRDTDPRGDLERWRALRFTPKARATVVGWDDPWGGRVRGAVGDTRFGLHATATLEIGEAGRYLLGARSDDGLRVIVDDRVVLESWTWKPAREELVEIELDSGSHRIVVEYFQIDGPAVLQLGLDPSTNDAAGPVPSFPADD